jgi:hypothetical protein
MTEQQLEATLDAFLRLALPPANDNAPPSRQCGQRDGIGDAHADPEDYASVACGGAAVTLAKAAVVL